MESVCLNFGCTRLVDNNSTQCEYHVSQHRIACAKYRKTQKQKYVELQKKYKRLEMKYKTVLQKLKLLQKN